MLEMFLQNHRRVESEHFFSLDARDLVRCSGTWLGFGKSRILGTNNAAGDLPRARLKTAIFHPEV